MDLLCSRTVLSLSHSLFRLMFPRPFHLLHEICFPPSPLSLCPGRLPVCSAVPCTLFWLPVLADGHHWQKISGYRKIRSRIYSPGSTSGHYNPAASSMETHSSCQTPIQMAAFSGLPYLFHSFTPSGWRRYQLPTVANPKVLLYPLLVFLNPSSVRRPSVSHRILTVG